MKNSRYIDIIIPIYNVENYLRQCVDSVINQTYKRINVILVDDGSPDNSPKICDEYAIKYNNVKVWSEVDLGTCRKTDIFITDVNFKLIDFQKSQFMFDEDNAEEVIEILKELNDKTFIPREKEKELVVNMDGEVIEENSLEMVDTKEKEAKGLFGDLM